MTSQPTTSRRRSCLSVPASSFRKLEKAPGVGADEVVIDLEDAVLASAKGQARGAALAALAGASWGDTAVSVRVNAPRSPWCHLDLIALGSCRVPPASVVVPKVESAGDVAFVERLLDGVEAARSDGSRRIRVQALIETASGLQRAGEIAAASDRLDALILGYADLAASLGRSGAAAADLDSWRSVQEVVLVAARAHGLQAIDGPYLGVRVDEAFQAAAARARDLGFDGKWAIHPVQVETLNRTFTPDAEEVTRAQAVVTALTRAESEGGQGATAVDGMMVDEAMRAAALGVLARVGRGPAAS